jgi:hypothetical protein
MSRFCRKEGERIVGTHCTIAKEMNDGTVKAVYCNWDGYISGVGKILQENYDKSKTEKLLTYGDISSLGPNIGESKNDFVNRDKNVCCFYHRDRGESKKKADVFPSREKYQYECSSMAEYLYLMDEQGVWYVCTRKSGSFIPLKELYLGD